MSQDKQNINELLTALKAVSKETGYQIWIPSLSKEVKFSDISTGQQKELIRALVDNPVYRTNFILSFFQILKDNCQDQTVDIGNLNILDKFAIAVQLRSLAFGDKVKVEVNDEPVMVDIKGDYKQKFTILDFPFSPIYDASGVSVQVTVPTIAREAQLEKELRTNLAKGSVESYEDVRNILADAYIGELAKYICKVNIGEQTINLDQLDFKSAYKVVEALPVALVKQVVGYLELTQQIIGKWATFPTVVDPTNTVEITVDAAFFAGK